MSRRPKPYERQIAEGDPRMRGKHKLAAKLKRVPHPSGTLPPCPAHLDGKAREAWEFWVDELVKMSLDATCDAMMLEGACINYARAVDADIRVNREGSVISEPAFFQGKAHRTMKRTKKNPAVTVSNAAWAHVRAFCSEFGLSPASRVRLSVTSVKDSPADIHEMLSGPRLTDEEKRKLQ